MLFEKELNDAITRGTWKGLIKGLHTSFLDDVLKVSYVKNFLEKKSYKTKDPAELGIRDALLELGFLKETWYGKIYRR